MAIATLQPRRNLATADSSRKFSPNIWTESQFESIREGTVSGVTFFDDFNEVPLIGTQTTEIAHGRYKVFNTGAGVVTQVSALNSVEKGGGWLSIGVDTDNDSGSIAHSYPSLMLTGLESNSGLACFEARIAFSPITTNGLGWFIGLAEVEQWTLATGVPFNGGDAITNSASAIGFRKPEDDTTTFDTVYSDRATSFTNIGDAEGTGAVAFTPFKVGFKYDPKKTDNCVRFFINNIELTTKLSRTALRALTNLDANAVGFLAAAIADSSGTSGLLFIDWIRGSQLIP